jgi:hypothetical protein
VPRHSPRLSRAEGEVKTTHNLHTFLVPYLGDAIERASVMRTPGHHVTQLGSIVSLVDKDCRAGTFLLHAIATAVRTNLSSWRILGKILIAYHRGFTFGFFFRSINSLIASRMSAETGTSVLREIFRNSA